MFEQLGKRLLFEREDTYSLRGLCMLAIIAHHLCQWTSTRYGVFVPFPLSQILHDAGYLGSALFFLLSGYGLSLSLWKKKLTFSDVIRRLSKLYLPFVYFWIIGFIIVIVSNGNPHPQVYLGLIDFTLPLAGGGRWFIISIISLYFLEISLTAIMGGGKSVAYWILGIVLAFIFAQLWLKLPQIWYNSILGFPIGSLCAAYKNEVQSINSREWAICLLICFLLIYGMSILCGTSHYWPTSYAYFLVPVFKNLAGISLALIAIIAVIRIRITSIVLNYIGVNSYCFFIGHQVFVTFADIIPNINYTYNVVIYSNSTCSE